MMDRRHDTLLKPTGTTICKHCALPVVPCAPIWAWVHLDPRRETHPAIPQFAAEGYSSAW